MKVLPSALQPSALWWAHIHVSMAATPVWFFCLDTKVAAQKIAMSLKEFAGKGSAFVMHSSVVQIARRRCAPTTAVTMATASKVNVCAIKAGMAKSVRSSNAKSNATSMVSVPKMAIVSVTQTIRARTVKSANVLMTAATMVTANRVYVQVPASANPAGWVLTVLSLFALRGALKTVFAMPSLETAPATKVGLAANVISLLVRKPFATMIAIIMDHVIRLLTLVAATQVICLLTAKRRDVLQIALGMDLAMRATAHVTSFGGLRKIVP